MWGRLHPEDASLKTGPTEDVTRCQKHLGHHPGGGGVRLPAAWAPPGQPSHGTGERKVVSLSVCASARQSARKREAPEGGCGPVPRPAGRLRSCGCGWKCARAPSLRRRRGRPLLTPPSGELPGETGVLDDAGVFQETFSGLWPSCLALENKVVSIHPYGVLENRVSAPAPKQLSW